MIVVVFQKHSSHYILNMGSRIYVESSVPLRQRFAAIAQEFYNTEIKTLNFQSPIGAASIVNNWVSDLTHGKITNLVKPGQ
jgi:serpin A